ncbi:MAG TPA: hypothetical protein VFC78_09230 [Tepidisphaeraceae bacterium]|nr:hypothetical protein [Tepidisphaeraceae bacterium]
MARPIPSESVHSEIDELLLGGQALTASEAEEMFLDAHLPDLARLAVELDDKAFERHEAVKLLMSHGSRRWEDSL